MDSYFMNDFSNNSVNLNKIYMSRWLSISLKFFPVVAIFFAVRLNKAKLPDWVDWVLTAFVVFHVLVHLILTVRIFDLLNLHMNYGQSWKIRREIGSNHYFESNWNFILLLWIIQISLFFMNKFTVLIM